MRNTFILATLLLTFLGVTLPQAVLADEGPSQKMAPAPDLSKATPSGTVDFDVKQLRLIFGGSKGKGTLHYNGQDYKFSIKGGTIGGVGYSEVKGAGDVYFLKQLEDFSGTYSGIGMGAALVKGGGMSHFQNDKGVILSVKSKTDGLALNLGIGVAEVKLEQ